MLSLGGILCCWSEFECIKENSGKKERGVQHSLCSLGPLCGTRGRLLYVFFWPYSQLLILHFKVCNCVVSTLAQQLHILARLITLKVSNVLLSNGSSFISNESIHYHSTNLLQMHCIAVKVLSADLLLPLKNLDVFFYLVHFSALCRLDISNLNRFGQNLVDRWALGQGGIE